MGVAIDDSGRDEHAGAVDDLGATRRFDVRADFGDFTVFDEDRAVFDGALHHGENGCVLNEDDWLHVRRSCGGGEQSSGEERDNSRHGSKDGRALH